MMRRCARRVKSILRIKNKKIRIFLAELLGTFMLVTIGNCAVAQAVLFPKHSSGFLSVNIAYSLGAGLGVYTSLRASGGHINPAITLGFAILGLVKWRLVHIYFLAQIIGAFFSSPVVYGCHYDALNKYDGGKRNVTGHTGTAGIFVVHPPDTLPTWSFVGHPIAATAVFLIAIAALVDQRNSNPHPGLIPFLVAVVVLACGLAFGETACLNPARDLGPRIFIAMAGWGAEAFSFRGYTWFWIPIVGPLVGSAMGALIYQLMVSLHWPEEYTSVDGEGAAGGENDASIPEDRQPLKEVSAEGDMASTSPTATTEM